ncbi:MAG: IS4 family transposase [Peptococcaceae bacterium]|nr:IS4 family transposase [Peptococcaceae bacterium]
MKEQSFSEARQKIKWEAFRDLFKTIVDLIYTGYYETWHGYRVSAIDGSKAQLPDDQNMRETFGAMGKGNTAATAQVSALYDVLNNVLIDAQIEPLAVGERELAERHIDALCKLPSFGKELLLFDRGYASFDLVEKMTGCNVHFVMRVKRGFNKSIDQLGLGDRSAFLHKKGHGNIIVRVLKFTLPSGEVETLITDIEDNRMGVNAFKGLYFKRWPVETKYNEIKNKLEVENFSGRTENAIRQDFFITMYMSNVAAVARWEAQVDVDEERELKDNKYSYHVNVNHAIGTLKDRFIEAMLEPNPRLRRKLIKHIIFLLGKCVVPTRPDRSLPRNQSPRKAKFRFNKKSNC